MPRPLILLALIAAAIFLWTEYGGKAGLPTAGGGGADRNIGAGAVVGKGARDAAGRIGN